MATDKAQIDDRTPSNDAIAAAQEIKQKGSKDAGTQDLRAELNMHEHKISKEALLAELETNEETGLSAVTAARRLQENGPNKLTPPPETPEWVKFMRTQTGFFSLLLWGGAVLCFVGYGLKEEVDNLYLGIVLTSVVLITGIFSYSQERKSSDLMNSFKNMMPPQALVLRGGEKKSVDAPELVVGDIVFVKSGNKIPADMRMLDCSDDMKVDNSCLTGESDPLSRKTQCTHDNPLETKNLAFFGTMVPSGNAKGVIVKTGDNTVMGRIARLATETGNEQTPINKEIEHFVKIVSGVAIFLGVTFFIIGIVLGVDWITNLVFMIGIIVANVPEGLLATVTVCLTLTAKRMYSKQVLVKNLEAVETLGSTTCICSDKTGTLTQNIMTVADLVYDQRIWHAECSITPEANFDAEDPTFKHLQRCATICNNATFEGKKALVEEAQTDADGKQVMVKVEKGADIPFKEWTTMGDGTQMLEVKWKTNGDASESAMIKFVQPFEDIENMRAANEKLKEIPFNSANKFQLSIHMQDNNADADRLLVIKGAPERIITRCDTILINGEVVEYTDEMREQTEKLQLQLSRMGRRVLGFAELTLPKEDYPVGYAYDIDNHNFPMGLNQDQVNWNADPAPSPRVTGKFTFLGLLALIDPPRPQVPGAVAKCKTAGIKVIMVTGDHPETAKAIAREVGIIWGDTKEDLEEKNAMSGLQEGDMGWEDPDLAPAVVVPGWTINNTDTTEEVWDDILDHDQVVFARTSPQQKLIIVENCQRRKEVVAVTGDGVNDAPALKKADIGVAMGIMGSEVSKEAADMILLDDNFASIVSGVEEGRLIFDNLKKSIAYTLSSNIPEIAPFLSFITIGIPLPLSTILILCVDLGTDMVPAISMAWENAEADIMRRNPRNAEVDRLVTKKLVSFAYLQVGVIQAMAGFYAWMTVLNDYGFPPMVLPGLGAFDNWGKQLLFCKMEGGVMRMEDGTAMVYSGKWGGANGAKEAFMAGYMFWDPSPTTKNGALLTGAVAGKVLGCDFPVRDFTGAETVQPGNWNPANFGQNTFTNGFSLVSRSAFAAMHAGDYVEYIPYRGRMSGFWDSAWLNLDAANPSASAVLVPGTGSAVRPIIYYATQPWGQWSLAAGNEDPNVLVTGTESAKAISIKCTAAMAPCTGNSKMFTKATISVLNNVTSYDDVIVARMHSWGATPSAIKLNVASRMIQKEALHHAQTAGFICIIVVQWADLTICKTRMLSIQHQGMRNPAMNFGLLFETCLGAALCYVPGVNTGLGTRALRLTHWFPGMPFSVVIFMYDEIRKYIMRRTSSTVEDPETKRISRTPGWVERNTYY